jgi:sulfoxide reductase heme-binding subunit YedZ
MRYGVHVAFVLIVLLTYFSVKVFFDPQKQIVAYVSTFGFLALLSTIFVLLIPVLLRFKKTSLTVYLSSERRWIGIYTFVFAAIHVFLVYNFFFGWDINRLLNHPNRLYLSMGTIALIIFALMAATSNNYSVKKLGKNWKRLHLLIYPALILILIHSFSIGLIYLKSTWAKAAILLIVAAVLTAKFFKYKKSK